MREGLTLTIDVRTSTKISSNLGLQLTPRELKVFISEDITADCPGPDRK